MLDINPNGKKMILTIDGGGMRGVISVAMLAELEARTGKPCYDLFDMVAGTSTGSIIAAAIAVGMSAGDILQTIYKERLPKGFRPRDFAFWLRYITGGLRYLYALEPFIESLVPIVAGKKVGDFRKPILFMTTKDVRTSDTYYIVSAGPGLEAVKDWPVSGCVAASSAAPIYFPPVAGNLIDGGVGIEGNPCLSACMEAMEYIGAAEGFVDGNVILMSVGTGYPPNKLNDGAAGRFWLADWIQYVIGEGLDDAGLEQTFNLRTLYGSRVDFRRYNPLLTRESVETALGISTSGRPDPIKLELDSASADQIALMEDIGREYSRKLDWTAASVMPWDTVGGHPKPGIEKRPVEWSKTPYR